MFAGNSPVKRATETEGSLMLSPNVPSTPNKVNFCRLLFISQLGSASFNIALFFFLNCSCSVYRGIGLFGFGIYLLYLKLYK
jgi:hypothetical protein